MVILNLIILFFAWSLSFRLYFLVYYIKYFTNNQNCGGKNG